MKRSADRVNTLLTASKDDSNSSESEFLDHLEREILAAAVPNKIPTLERFFKTQIGQYGHGDQFIGVTVPVLRALVKKHYRPNSDLVVIERFLLNVVHEYRICAILWLVHAFRDAEAVQDEASMESICTRYLRYAPYINNWDLVDLSAHHIVGAFCYHTQHRMKTPRTTDSRTDLQLPETLKQLVEDSYEHVLPFNVEDTGLTKVWLPHNRAFARIWTRRIAIVATFYYIKHDSYQPTLWIARHHIEKYQEYRVAAECKVQDAPCMHDLIHKAIGWMLREVGKRDLKVLVNFLGEVAHLMPRVMLRYSIEKLPVAQRKHYMSL